MNSARLLFVSLAFAVFCGPAAQAADDSMTDFLLADTDGDDCVSWEELRNRAVIIFHQLDVNGDGLIFGEEHPPAVNAAGETVRPSGVEIGSFQAELYIAFDTADKDQNGCLSRKEFSDG